MTVYRVLICDDNEQYVKRFRDSLYEMNAGNREYRIDVSYAISTSDARELISGGDYDIITFDTCMRDTQSSTTIRDNIYSRLTPDNHGASLIKYAADHCPYAKFFVISRLRERFSKEEFSFANAEYFCKDTMPLDKIVGRIINYFDTEKQRFLNNVFVVYGHHSEMHETVACYLRSLNLSVTNLDTSSRSGIATVFDLLEDCASKVDCAVVLLSGDDRAITKDDNLGIDVLTYRARQNVIFEMGMFAGLLGRDKVIVLHEKKPHFEFPSDINGVFYEEYDLNGYWKDRLKFNLNKIGFNL